MRLTSLLFALLALLSTATAGAQTPQQTVETTWRLLDYVAVDYAEAVANGRVINEFEYAEMTEFADTVQENLRALPAGPAKQALVGEALALDRLIAARSAPARVASAARALAADLLTAYPVPLAPRSAPDPTRGAALYAEHCASCHGATGQGNGPAAAALDPPPIDFTDRARASQRSVFALQQVITQGLEGTAMASFRHLPEHDRWALAFYSGQFASSPELAGEGERLWQSDPALRRAVPDLKTLVSLTPQGLAGRVGERKAAALMAYLRSSPQAVEQASAGSLSLTRERLAQSVAAYRRGNADEAERVALSAYLDGFEPLEPTLAARDRGLMRDIEGAMAELRAAIGRRAPAAEVEAQAQALDRLFSRAEARLGAPAESGLSIFLSALAILLREGVEALLVVVAMLAFLRKSDRQDVVAYVHGGWVAALLAGIVTWIVATQFIAISGASREITEGFGGILAAVILVSVGVWMHGKSQADAWQRYIRERMSKALTKRSAWFLFGLAFLVVYREAFETILFYAAMWTEGAKQSVLAGAAVGTVLLAALAWATMRFSLRLPIAQFFRYSSILIAILAVILAGKGVAALQEAGMIDVTPLQAVPQISALGLYPTMQVVLAQTLVIIALVLGFGLNGRAAARLQRAG